MKDSIIILILLILLPASQVSALDVPALKGRVNDYADLLSPGETADLQEKLELHEKETSKRAKREFFELGLQHAEKGTGILIMISLKERVVVVESGKAFEDKLPPDIWEGLRDMIINGLRAKAGRHLLSNRRGREDTDRALPGRI